MTDGATEPTAQKIHNLTPHSLRGLAHPLRMRLLASLRRDGPATASQLGDRLGESSGSTSYHLRQLAAHGFVEDDPERGKGRERWWRAAHQGTHFDASLTHDPDPAVRGAANLFFHQVATFHAEEVNTWIGTKHDWSQTWVDSADISDYTLRLTPDLAAELNTKMQELVESYRPLEPDEATPEAARVRVHTHVFPTHPSE
jgi:DNA-binding transcriptional ArsR family regulator